MLLFTAVALSLLYHLVIHKRNTAKSAPQGYSKWRLSQQILKPIPIALLILHSYTRNENQLITLGLFASMIGDVFLLWQDLYFIQGLLFFLTAHIIYIYSFSAAWVLNLPVLLALGGFVFLYLSKISSGVYENGGRALQSAVVVYSFTIATMMYYAIIVNEPVLIFGAAMFCISDAFIAWDGFVDPHPRNEFVIMATYYLAQICIAYSPSY